MPELLTQTEYATHAGVNKSTVHRWIKNGRIATEPSGKIDSHKADRLRQATESPLPHHQARKAQIDAEKATQSQTEQPGHTIKSLPAAEQIGLKLKFATMKEREAKAEIAGIELDKLAGLLIERVEVEQLLADFGATLRNLLEGLADRLTPTLSAHRGDTNKIHAEIDAAGRDLLEEISAHMQRKQEQTHAN